MQEAQRGYIVSRFCDLRRCVLCYQEGTNKDQNNDLKNSIFQMLTKLNARLGRINPITVTPVNT
jgi:hypothetical protein